jgi:hypothetical protein
LSVVFFLCLSPSKKGFHLVAQYPFVLREKVSRLLFRGDGFLFAVAKLSVTPTVRRLCPAVVFFFFLLYPIYIVLAVFILKIQSLPIKYIS